MVTLHQEDELSAIMKSTGAVRLSGMVDLASGILSCHNSFSSVVSLEDSAHLKKTLLDPAIRSSALVIAFLAITKSGDDSATYAKRCKTSGGFLWALDTSVKHFLVVVCCGGTQDRRLFRRGG